MSLSFFSSSTCFVLHREWYSMLQSLLLTFHCALPHRLPLLLFGAFAFLNPSSNKQHSIAFSNFSVHQIRHTLSFLAILLLQSVGFWIEWPLLFALVSLLVFDD